MKHLLALLLVFAAVQPAWATSPTGTPGTANTVGSGDNTVNIPSCAVGGILFFFLTYDTNSTTPTWPNAAGDSTTSLYAQATSSGLTGHGRYRVVTGSESATLTVTNMASARSSLHPWCVTGGDTGTAPSTGTTATGSGSTTPDPPSVSITNGTNFYFTVAHTSGAATFNSCPTNFTTDCTDTPHGSGSLAVGTRQNTSASEDPGTFSWTGTNFSWYAQTIAVGPAASTQAPRSMHQYRLRR